MRLRTFWVIIIAGALGGIAAFLFVPKEMRIGMDTVWGWVHSMRLWVFLVMFIVGAVGGLANFVMTPSESKSFWKSFLTSILATLTVPAFLNMTSSDLLTQIISKDDLRSLLVFIGFCVIAALFSERFLGTVADKLFQDVKKTKEELKQTKDSLDKVKDLQNQTESQVDSLLSVRTKPEPVVAQPRHERALMPQESHDVDSVGRKVLNALSSPDYDFRSLGGLASDTNLDQEKIKAIIDGLIRKDFVAQTKRKDGFSLYYITPKGQEVVQTEKDHEIEPS